jgi:hypothetical protein
MNVYTSGPFLSDRVDDSFRALRQRVIDETGFDYLSIFGDMWRGIGASARPGQSERSWHKAGRAFDINQGSYGPGQAVVVVQEQFGDRIFWRVYLRTARQDGSAGEPLRVAPWDFTAQPESEDSPPTGGAARVQIPGGYWLDFTRLAADYGWRSVGALRRWRRTPDTDWGTSRRRTAELGRGYARGLSPGRDRGGVRAGKHVAQSVKSRLASELLSCSIFAGRSAFASGPARFRPGAEEYTIMHGRTTTVSDHAAENEGSAPSPRRWWS